MIYIHYVIGQISPNLFKVDATTLQRATYKSSMMLTPKGQREPKRLFSDLGRVF
jgi:hypothetical protein